jgi:hypothetical protein
MESPNTSMVPLEQTVVDEIASRISQAITEKGETLESVLKALREETRPHYRSSS